MHTPGQFSPTAYIPGDQITIMPQEYSILQKCTYTIRSSQPFQINSLEPIDLGAGDTLIATTDVNKYFVQDVCGYIPGPAAMGGGGSEATAPPLRKSQNPKNLPPFPPQKGLF